MVSNEELYGLLQRLKNNLNINHYMNGKDRETLKRFFDENREETKPKMSKKTATKKTARVEGADA